MRRRKAATAEIVTKVAWLGATIGMNTAQTRVMLIQTTIKRAPWWERKLRPQRTARLARVQVDHALRVAEDSWPNRR